MSQKKPIIAILYDFDSTLSRTDMQNFSFIPSLGLTPAEFWGMTTKFSEETGCERTLSYLFMMQKLTKERGIKMTREWLREQGAKIEFFPGVETWFKRINDYGKEHNVIVEHYLVSSGNKEIVEGCSIAKEFKRLYACEFMFDENGEPIWPKIAINYTQKTQYFFRISKGVYDESDDAGVNNKRPDRRIPYSNMVYIGDGMTDIPTMILVKENGGRSIAVYPIGKEDKVQNLYDDGRVNFVCPANYNERTSLESVMKLIIRSVEINNSLKIRENKNPFQD
ncbi:MAG: haloacid dehalogenase-like hydrolase [Bacilli bacterium]|nr:haloacid dehalogenase-like hydrolase [Bacilli bacterium]